MQGFFWYPCSDTFACEPPHLAHRSAFRNLHTFSSMQEAQAAVPQVPTHAVTASAAEVLPLTPAASRRSPARAVLATLRPKQWVKNVLVIAAAGAAGALGRDDVPVRV